MRPNKVANIVFRVDGKSLTFKVGALVLELFVGPKPTSKSVARHLNDCKANNRVDNLAWGTQRDNYNDGVLNGKNGPNTPGAKLRSEKLKGKPRPDWVKAKISKTKQVHRARQVFGGLQDPITGRFISRVV